MKDILSVLIMMYFMQVHASSTLERDSIRTKSSLIIKITQEWSVQTIKMLHQMKEHSAAYQTMQYICVILIFEKNNQVT